MKDGMTNGKYQIKDRKKTITSIKASIESK